MGRVFTEAQVLDVTPPVVKFEEEKLHSKLLEDAHGFLYGLFSDEAKAVSQWDGENWRRDPDTRD